MAVTTTTRLGLTRWSAGSDPLRRTQLDTSMANLELWAGRFEQGTLAARPAAAIRDRFYFATDTPGGALGGTLFRDSGTAWHAIANVQYGKAYTLRPAGGTDYLHEYRTADLAVLLARVHNDGSVGAPNLTALPDRKTAPHLLVGKAVDVTTGAGTADFSIGWDGTLDADGVTLGSAGQTDHAIVQETGDYRVTVNVRWGTGGVGQRGAFIKRSDTLAGGTTVLAGTTHPARTGGISTFQGLSYEGRFTAGQFIWPMFWQDSGNAQSIQGAPATNFAVTWLRP